MCAEMGRKITEQAERENGLIDDEEQTLLVRRNFAKMVGEIPKLANTATRTTLIRKVPRNVISDKDQQIEPTPRCAQVFRKLAVNGWRNFIGCDQNWDVRRPERFERLAEFRNPGMDRDRIRAEAGCDLLGSFSCIRD